MEFKKYLGKYATSADVQSAVDNNTLSKPYVAYIENDDVIDYNSIISYKTIPLTFEILGNGNVIFANNGNITKTIEYKLNDDSWTEITSTTGGTAIAVVSGDIVQFRGDNSSYGILSSTDFISLNCSCQFKIKGNIMSLINSTNFSGLTTLESNYTFKKLFYGDSNLIDVSNLVLPATALTESCYSEMFRGCTGITTAPELPATTIGVRSCYNMFNGCRNLNYIKCLATSIGYDGTYGWVTGVQTNSGTFITPSSTNWRTGNNGIPYNWTRVNA